MYSFCSILARDFKALINLNNPVLFYFCFARSPDSLSTADIGGGAPAAAGRFAFVRPEAPA
jgi:hypothetical protein